MPWYKRLQIQAYIKFELLPQYDMSWKEWAFDPACNFIKPDVLATSVAIPREFPRHILLYIDESTEGRPVKTGFFWASCALRILGFDFGVGAIYTRDNSKDA